MVPKNRLSLRRRSAWYWETSSIPIPRHSEFPQELMKDAESIRKSWWKNMEKSPFLKNPLHLECLGSHIPALIHVDSIRAIKTLAWTCTARTTSAMQISLHDSLCRLQATARRLRAPFWYLACGWGKLSTTNEVTHHRHPISSQISRRCRHEIVPDAACGSLNVLTFYPSEDGSENIPEFITRVGRSWNHLKPLETTTLSSV